MKKANFYIILCIMFIACEEVVNWDLQESVLPPLVVDGMITSEKRAHVVRLTYPMSDLNQPVVPVNDATVSINDGDTTIILTETPPGSGFYLTDSTIQGVYGKIYTLIIDHQSNLFTASATMEPVTPIIPLVVNEDGSQEGFYNLRFIDSDEPAMYKYLIDWSQLSEYDTIPSAERKAKIVAFTLSSIDASEMFKPKKEEIPFPAGTQIILKKYSLSDDHQEFARTLLSETEWRGGIFDVLPGNVITNINGGAVGFFAASVVLIDTVYVDPQIHLGEIK